MASIKERNGKYCLIYGYRDKTGKTKQKWETYSSKAEALKRKTEVEYKTQQGIFVVPQCKILKDLLAEYVSLYGKERWALKTYETNTGLINNYILPYIGNVKVSDINTRFLEKFYQDLQNKPAVIHPYLRCEEQKTVGPSRIRDVHRLLRSCFNQAVKWELIEKNPAINATVPKYAQESREVWDSDALMEALNQSDDPILTLAINLTFSCTLRVGEMLGLTWDCVDITEESLEKGFCSVYINKELQRVTKDAVQALNSKDIISVFPEIRKTCRSVRVLKKPKTESSIRKVYLPQTVARMLVSHKEEQEKIKSILGDEYHDYGLVMATPTGTPIGESVIRKKFHRMIENAGLDPVDFYSLRHSSITAKLKLNHGDIKAVQGDSGHSQTKMVTDVYSHILDEDRVRTAQKVEEAFYGNAGAKNPRNKNMIQVPEGMDADQIAKALASPEMQALLAAYITTSQRPDTN